MAAPAHERLRGPEAEVPLTSGARPGARLVVPALLVLVALALFPDAFLRGRVFYYRDIHLQWVPQMEVLVRCVASGSWPLWNPYASFGQPLLANPNYEVYYPTTVLNLLMAPWTYYRLFVLFHLLLGGLGAYALSRRLGLWPVCAALAGVAWMASGPFASLVSLWNHLAGAAWMPWSAWAGHRAGGRPTFAAVATWGAVMAMPVLAGSPEMALFTAVFGVLFALGAGLRGDRTARAALTTVMAGLLALGLSAGQWLPSLEVARRSRRVDLPPAQRELWTIPPAALAQSLLPALLDELPLRPNVRAALYDSREPFLRSLYLGLSGAALVAVALLSGRRAALALAGLVVVMTLVALGRHTPVAGALMAVLPPLRVLRFPAKAMVPVSLAWALLAALGLQAWAAADDEGRAKSVARVASAVTAALGLAAAWMLRARVREVAEALVASEFTTRAPADVMQPVATSLLAAAGAAVAMAVLLWRRPRSAAVAAGLATLLVGGDLVAANSGLTPVSDPELFTARPPALAHLPVAPGGRVFSFDYFEGGQAERFLGHHGYLLKVPRDEWRVPWVEAAALRFGGYPSVLAYWQIQDGFRIDWLGLYPPPMTALVGWSRRAMLTPAFHRLLRAGAVTHVLALHEEGLEDFTRIAVVPSLFLEDVHVFAVPDALPEAYVVGGSRVAADADAGRLLVDPSFDLRREVVLAAGTPRASAASFTGTARIAEWRPDRVTVLAQLSEPGYVVLVAAHDPGWRATVDGRPAEVARANVGFRAVEAGAGTHRVVFTYRPRAATIGLGVSVATLLACALALAAPRRTAAERA